MELVKVWSHSTLAKTKKFRLEELQVRNSDDTEEQTMLHQEIKELLTREEILWRQRSRIQWLKDDALSMFSETHGCKVVEIVIPELDEMRTAHVVSIGSEAVASLTLDFQDGLQIMSLPNASGAGLCIITRRFSKHGCHSYSNYWVKFCKSKMKVQYSHNSRICELALRASKRPKQQDVPKRARLRESIRQK
ncbi:fatty acid amide hydrolase [Tanacetum coccineum]